MKHSKKIAAILLAAALTAGAYLTTVGAAAPGAAPAPSGSAQPQASSFADIPSGAWYENEVAWCVENGIISAVSDTSFAPGTDIIRADVALALYRAKGSPEVTSQVAFSDVDTTSNYADAISWTASNGIMEGYGGGVFGTRNNIRREELATVLWRYAGEPDAEAGEDFADEARIAAYASTAVDWARANQVVNGKPGNLFDPKAAITRAEVAAVMYRYLNPAEEPVVYMTTDISPEGMMAVYEALNWSPTGKVAVKLSTGEPPASNYLRPELIADVVKEVDGTIVECNTAYGGSRAQTAMHYQVAEDHGFTKIAEFQILDEDGSMTLPVSGGTRLTENYVGAHFDDYDSYLVLSHFKGHATAGFGGAIKNISIGLGSQEGKCVIHTGGAEPYKPLGRRPDRLHRVHGGGGQGGIRPPGPRGAHRVHQRDEPAVHRL